MLVKRFRQMGWVVAAEFLVVATQLGTAHFCSHYCYRYHAGTQNINVSDFATVYFYIDTTPLAKLMA